MWRLDRPAGWSVVGRRGAAAPAGVRRTAAGRRAAPDERAPSAANRPRPAPYVFGPWYQPQGDDEQAVLAGMQRRDVPLSLAQTYTHYLPCEAQLGKRDAERARAAFFHGSGLAITTYFNPMICTTHTRFGRPGTLQLNPAGAPVRLPLFDAAGVHRRPVRLHGGGAAGRSTGSCSTRRSRTGTTAGWRTSASTRRSTRARLPVSAAARCTTSIRPSTTAARFRRRAARGSLHPLRLDRHGALRTGGVGRRPDRRLGLRRPALGRDQRADDGRCPA